MAAFQQFSISYISTRENFIHIYCFLSVDLRQIEGALSLVQNTIFDSETSL